MFDADVILNRSDRTKSEQHIMEKAVVSCAVFAGQKDSVGQSITLIHATDQARKWGLVGTRSKANETQKK